MKGIARMLKNQGLLILVLIMLFSSVSLGSSAPIDNLQLKSDCTSLYSFKIYGAFGRTSEIGSDNMHEFLDMYFEKMTNTLYCVRGEIYLRSDIGEKRSVLFGGFLYSSIPVETQQLYLWAKSNERDESAYVSASYVYYDLNNLDSLTLDFLTHYPYLLNFLNAHKQDLALSNTYYSSSVSANKKSGSKSTEKTINLNFQPGIYYAVGGLDLNYGNTDKDDGFAKIRPIRINSEYEWSLDYNLKSIDSSGKGYLFSHRPLTAQELNLQFKDYVETVPELCVAAGGQMFPGVDYDKIPIARRCCGDDSSDDDKYYVIEGTTYHCYQGKWSSGTNQDVCEALIDSSLISSNVYTDVVEPGVRFNQISIIQNGSDGCCGDDPRLGCVLKNPSPSKCEEISDSSICASYGCTPSGSCKSKNPFDFEFQCFGESFSSLSYDDCVALSACYWDSPTNECVGSIGSEPDCASLSEEACGDSSICEWREGNDLGYVLGSIGEDSGTPKYLCGNNLYDVSGKPAIRQINDETKWTWWSADGNGVPFRIQHIQGIDYISNGNEWFYCDTSNSNLNTFAKPVNEKQSFTNYGSSESGVSCVQLLNTLMEHADGNPFKHISGYADETFKLTGESSTYVCSSSSFDHRYPFYTSSQNSCLTSCRISNNMGTVRTNMDQNSAFRTALLASYCELNPHNTDCKPTGSSCTLNKDCSGGTVCDTSTGSCTLPESVSSNSGGNVDFIKQGISTTHYGFTSSINSLTTCAPSFAVNGMQLYGFQCEPDNVCVSSRKYDVNGNVCCVSTSANDAVQQQFCISPQETTLVNQEQCQEMQGHYLPNSDALTDFYCSTGNNQDRCCVGGNWLIDSVAIQNIGYRGSDAFICYAQSEYSRFAECCSDWSCYNAGMNNLFFDSNDYDNGYMGLGGVLHQLVSFDQFTEGMFKPRFRSLFFPSSSQSESIEFYNDRSIYPLDNWSDFQSLEFDIAFVRYDNVNVTLSLSNDYSCSVTVSDYLSLQPLLEKGYGLNMWQHVSIPLTDFTGCDFATTTVSNQVTFTLSKTYDEDYVLLLDSVYLTPNTATQTTENLFCSGEFSSWISNLDGQTNAGFNSGANVREYAAHKFTCDAQASYLWTGRRCCGDDTFATLTYSQAENAEYYTDVQGACFHGIPIMPNEVVDDVLRGYTELAPDPYFSSLMFYDGEFFACNTSVFSNHKVNYGGEFESDSLVTNVGVYTVKGGKICVTNTDEAGRWAYVSEVSKPKIIASKLLEIAQAEKLDYDIYCDEFNKATTSFSMHQETIDSFNGQIDTLCTYRSIDDDDNKVLVGLSYTTDTLGLFLDELEGHLRNQLLLHPTATAFTSACDAHLDDTTTANNFFKECTLLDNRVMSHINYFGMRQNKELKLLFFAIVDDKEKDFKGFFDDGERTFLQRFVSGFLNFFSGLFGGVSETQDSWQANQPEALFESYGDMFSYPEKIFLSKRGDKSIVGLFAEDGDDALEFKEHYVIEYKNFTESVYPLAEIFYDTSIEKHFINNESTNTQTMYFENPVDERIGVRPSILFDWRYVTTALQSNVE